ncbi:hypothetical protein AC1031_009614 [Aphanomyces cochlioides]|nr:hypothetical protein AC1031_009614 [Aphanomyces cochlioides]
MVIYKLRSSKACNESKLDGMTKVHEIRRAIATASCTRWSLPYKLIFVIICLLWPTFLSLAYLQQLYNDNTMDESLVSRRDIATNTSVIRFNMSLPFVVSRHDAFDYYIRIPVSPFFSSGVRDFMTDFLTANKTSRNQMHPWQFCQHNRILTMTYSELCIWMVEQSESEQYTVWWAASQLESPTTSWIKFAYRWLISSYIIYLLWRRYYCYYIPLLSNLQHIGLAADYVRYEIVLGDPAYAILSDPVVSLAMAVDLWWGMGYMILAIIGVAHYHNFWLYVNGCIYLSRYVWLSYLGMQLLSAIVKWRRWENWYAQVDPAFLAISAYLYSGPIMSLLCSTRISAKSDNEAIECISGKGFPFREACIRSSWHFVVSMVMSTLPFQYSRIVMAWCRQKSNRVGPRKIRSIEGNVSNYEFNDLKARLILAFTMKKQTKRLAGGILHTLYRKNTRHRKLPLISHRADDYFVFCYQSDGSLDQQVRLSLISCLDPQLGEFNLAIPTCNSLHFHTVSVISNDGCATFMPTSNSTLCIHPGGSNCLWVM